MDLFDIAVARKLAGGGGGGGSSDFSKKTISVSAASSGHSFNITSNYDSVTGLVKTEDGYITDTNVEMDVGVSYTINVEILNGSFMYGYVDNGGTPASDISVMGAATVHDDGGYVYLSITGDCSITIS